MVVAAAGAIGLIAVRIRPPVNRAASSLRIGVAEWRYSYAVDSMTRSLKPDGTAMTAIRTPKDVMGSNPRSSRRLHLREWQPFGRSRAYGKLSSTGHATLRGHEEELC